MWMMMDRDIQRNYNIRIRRPQKFIVFEIDLFGGVCIELYQGYVYAWKRHNDFDPYRVVDLRLFLMRNKINIIRWDEIDR